MRHLLGIDDLSKSEILQILIDARQLPTGAPQATGKSVGLIFMEPSTRTRSSFQRAAELLGHSTLYLNPTESSLTKGETLEDTLLNLYALQVNAFVVRMPESISAQSLRNFSYAPILNAGDGVTEHPSQALLDLANLWAEYSPTSYQENSMKGFKLAIVGDLRRSRVASSWSKLAPKMGIELKLVSPQEWRPQWGSALSWGDSLQDALSWADAVMVLRVQKERSSAEDLDSAAFAKGFQLQPQLLKPQQKFLHPGPVNWGVELSLEMANDPRSLILSQVRHGLLVRAALLKFFLETVNRS